MGGVWGLRGVALLVYGQSRGWFIGRNSMTPSLCKGYGAGALCVNTVGWGLRGGVWGFYGCGGFINVCVCVCV